MDKRMKGGLKKYSQHDLRRLMLEQKSKAAATEAAKGTKTEKVESPLAKYDAAGLLSCVICRTSIKSANVWKVHINSKQHKQKVETAKQLKQQLMATHDGKMMPPPAATPPPKQQQQLRPAIKNTTKATSDTNIEDNEKRSLPALVEAPNRTEATAANAGELSDNPLPEKFFDDPMRDAKIRNTEYVDPQDQEWDRFQREIKEESSMSNAIIAGEQDEAAVDRQIVEIDEQMERWARVIHMEEQKEKVLLRAKLRGESNGTVVNALSEGVGSSDEEDDALDGVGETFDEFSDWRAKKF